MMTEARDIESYYMITDFSEDRLFKLQCLIKATDIQHSVQCEHKRSLFLALSTASGDIILYFRKFVFSEPTIKRIPWFQGAHKQISAFCFDPHGSWLLVATVDSYLYIIPALILIEEENNVNDGRWRTDDITSLPCIGSQSSYSRPAAIVWWQSIKTSTDVAIVGTEFGEIILINLNNGQRIDIVQVHGHIVSLHICHDRNNEVVSLLITNQSKQQWWLLLENRIYSRVRLVEDGENYSMSPLNETICDNVKSFASTRARLQGLKQLSVEKLATLRQKLVESKNQSIGDDGWFQDGKVNRNNNLTTLNVNPCSEEHVITDPEPISEKTFFMPHYDGEGQLMYTCHHIEKSHISVHGSDLSAIPLSVHKVIESTKSILLTQSLFFITDSTEHTLYILSDKLSEISMHKDCKFNSESIIEKFCFETNKEIIHAVYKLSHVQNTAARKLSQHVDNTYDLKMKDGHAKIPLVDTCIIITNCAVYQIILRRPLLSTFMELVLKKNELEKASKLAMIFGMDTQVLFEYTADILLANKEFSRAIALYKLSKCRLLKSVLKFASAGHTSELLNYLTHCLSSPNITEMPVRMRIHLSNLCVLAFMEMTLRTMPHQSKAIYKDFLYFLSTNSFYDELVAIDIAGECCLWEVLHHLATQKCLYEHTLEVLMKIVHSFDSNNTLPYGLLICLSEPNLMQAMVVNFNLARKHMSFILSNLLDLQIFVLQRLVTLYDPTNPVLRPRLIKCKARHRTASYSSQSSQCDSLDFADNSTEADTLVEEILETFLLILITLIHKKRSLNHDNNLIYNIHLLGTKKEHVSKDFNVDFKRRPLSAGFSHVALIRNGDMYTWGSSVQNRLGAASILWKDISQKTLHFFRNMELEVFSVSCGHCHTLTVTNNGVYVWGSNHLGQLGLGKILQCSSPELISSLAQEVIVDAVAGQYHSMALTADGRVFTWGWGVHGQLGHGNTNKCYTPTLVTSLLGTLIKRISAGYAHSLALSDEGDVYIFGGNVFGQLGNSNNVKSTTPIKVLLSEKISLIATGYFHNLAVSTTNKLYTWGASPQVLRLQAQAQKKTRILEQQEAANKQTDNVDKNFIKNENNSTDNKNIKENMKENNTQNCLLEATSCVTEVRKTQSENTSMKNMNVGLLEESQTHLKPTLVDTSLVKGQIIQISTGCHHNALLTKDGSLYLWGRNLDGQIGNGTRSEVLIPTPLNYNPASIFAQVPPRHNNWKKGETTQTMDLSENSSSNVNDGNVNSKTKSVHTEGTNIKENVNPIMKSIIVSCGYDFTVAMQPGGTILAWGNNSKGQLSRVPLKDIREGEDKLVLVKSSKRVVRLPHAHVVVDVPNQVPNIPAPVISYQSYDIPSLAGSIVPLSIIEKTPDELTLHYVLEHFTGLYDPTKIMEKCIELKNYQACSNIAALQHNFSDAFSYQLKALNVLNSRLSDKFATSDYQVEPNISNIQDGLDISSSTKKSSSSNTLEKNIELFNKHVENNLIESVEDRAAKNKLKLSASKSLNSLQMFDESLYSFDCQGGAEELCKEPKHEEMSLEVSEDTLDSDLNVDDPENVMFENNLPLEYEKINVNLNTVSQKCASRRIDSNETITIKENYTESWKKNIQKSDLTNEIIKVFEFYLREIENESDTVKCTILENTLEFWIEHNLSIQTLESIFSKHIDTIFYPLGLLLFCKEIIKVRSDVNKNDTEVKNESIINLFSVKFCLQICSMLMQHINDDQPITEYIKHLSSFMADHYGSPVAGYPGSNGNSTSAQMMEGIISTISSEDYKSRSFIHVKDSEAVYRLLAINESSMVFTCGHHFPLSVYQTEVISGMETELLTSQSLVLPCTAQFLSQILSETSKPRVLCPLCVPRALGALVKKSSG